MSRLVHEFPDPFESEDGDRYTVRVHGYEEGPSHWRGWIEFVPRSGDPPLHTELETSQSTYDHLEYWALGLTDAYLEMALLRARDLEGATAAPGSGARRAMG